MPTPKKPRSQFKDPNRRPRGEGIKVTKAIQDKICEAISKGKALAHICKPKTMPSPSSVRDRLLVDPLFAAAYARAREDQGEYYADEIIRVSRDKTIDPQDKRVQVDALKWVASKLKPAIYGDRQTIKHEGDGDMAERLGAARDRDNVVSITQGKKRKA